MLLDGRCTMFFHDLATGEDRLKFTVIAELIRKKFDVYIPQMDLQKYDCIIRQEQEGKLRYFDIQIMANSTGMFDPLKMEKGRENLYYVFYAEQAKTFWVIPSLQLEVALMNRERTKLNNFGIELCVEKEGIFIPNPRYIRYENSFDLLKWKPDELVEPRRIFNERIQLISIKDRMVMSESHNAGIRVLRCRKEIKTLQGTILETLDQHKKFSIVNVSQKSVRIIAGPEKKLRNISFEKEIAPAYLALLDGRRLKLADIRVWSEFSTSFVSAILSNLSGVNHITRPIEIFI
jgi:hypothetical protein